MNPMVAALAVTFSGMAMAQAPAGTLEIEADGCKLYLPQSEARDASGVRWSGTCSEGLAEGRGVLRIYSGGTLNLTAERTFSRGAMVEDPQPSMIPPNPRPKAPPIQTRTK